MKPVKTLIVDDEVFVAESLKALLDWTALGFEIVGTCYSAESALSFLERHSVDLLLCDIKMPGMTGLELISQVRSRWPHIESIIVSGYSDFTYAQTAIRHGAIAYCLKPFNEQETQTVLESARKKIYETRKKREYILTELLFLSDDLPTAHLQHNLTVLGFNLKSPIYVCMMLGCHIELNDISLNMHLSIGNHKYVYLVQPFGPLDDIIKVLNHVCEQNEANAGIAPVNENQRISEAIEHARQCAMHGFISEKHEVVSYEFLPAHARQRRHDLSSLLPSSGMNHERKNQYINHVCAVFLAERYTVRDAYHFYNLLISQPAMADSIAAFDFDGYESMAEEFKSLRNMLSQILLADKIQVLNETDSHSWIRSIKSFCEKNYAEPISITMASDMLHVSPSYFSTLFKRETGENFTAYVTNLRLNKARELLISTKRNVSDIAIEVGYSDYYYFTKVFRKYYGITPTQYRQSQKTSQDEKSR